MCVSVQEREIISMYIGKHQSINTEKILSFDETCEVLYD